MKTKILKLTPNNPQKLKIQEAAKIINLGGLVAFPTETVYGLGANAFNEKAIAKIFLAKERPADDPLIVHISETTALEKIVLEIPDCAQKLIKQFWPGPLSLIFKKGSLIPTNVTAGLDTVAIRMPSNKIALQLIKLSGIPIAAPSANLFGKPSPTIAQHVINDLDGKIDLIIDGGPTDIGVESTILDVTTTPPTLLRPGGITLEMIEKVIGKIEIHPLTIDKSSIIEIKAPGMSYKHYAPLAKVILLEGNTNAVMRIGKQLAREYNLSGKKVGFLKNKKDLYRFAKTLFKSFRKFDQDHFDVIIVGGVPETGLGLAIMNRLRRAATEIIKV